MHISESVELTRLSKDYSCTHMYSLVQIFVYLLVQLLLQNVVPKIPIMRIPTIAVTLRNFRDKNLEQAIRLRVTYQRQSVFKSLGIKTKETTFKENATGYKHVMVGDAKHLQKNTYIKQEFEKLEKSFYDLGLKDELTMDMVKTILDNKPAATLKLIDQAQDYIDKTIDNKGTLRRWGFCLDLLKTFSPTASIYNIDKKWLISFEDFLKLKYTNPNSRLAPLKFVRAVVNFSIERGIEMEYPFGVGKYKLPGEIKKLRNYLTQPEMKAIEKLVAESKDKNIHNAGAWFMVQCYSGLRYSDIEGWNEHMVRDNRIYFADVKTNTAHFIPIYKELGVAIENVKDLKPMAYEQYKRTLYIIGTALGLNFKLTSHIGRHTFAVQYLERGGNVFVLQSLMGHSDIKTTMVYAKVTSKGIEDDMKKVRSE